MTTEVTAQALHDALIRALEPIARHVYPPPGDGAAWTANAAGVDVWDSHVGDVIIDPDGTCHAYVYVQDTSGGVRQTRAVKAGSVLTYRPVLTVAGGTPRKVRWAVEKVRAALDGAVLTGEDRLPVSAPVHEGFARREYYDPGPMRLDDDPSPPRWVTTIQYTTEAC